MIHLDGVPPAKFSGLELKLLASHQAVMEMDGNSGSISGHGVTAGVTYDPVAQTLDITVKSHPWYEPLGVVESAITSNIKAALA